jgi:hypothetical protein
MKNHPLDAQQPPQAQPLTVYQMDAGGIFVGATTADPSPMEAGVWLIPAGCVEIAPPECGAGQFARWTGAAWAIENIPPAPKPEPAPPEAPKLTREAFCVALIGAGILTESEATEAALGAWPPKFEPALSGKELVEVLTIKNLWRDTKTVTRDAPLFLDLLSFYAAARSLPPAAAQVLGDQIFLGAK